MAKRAFDVVVALLLLVLLAPVMLLIGVAIRLDSPGPALFRQVRVTRGGQAFQMLKFRSMRVQSSGPLITTAGDARITRVGAFLRHAKLDEIPQLINVIKGDMSLVGPRPEVPRYVALYPPELRDLILSVRPGITDEASVEFADEGKLLGAAEDPEHCYVTQILPRKLELYARYARQHSVAGDLRILLRTLAVLVRRPTAP